MVVEELVIDELAAGGEEINDIHPGFNKLGVLYGYLSLSNIIVPSGLLCCLRHCMWVCGCVDLQMLITWCNTRGGEERHLHMLYMRFVIYMWLDWVQKQITCVYSGLIQ